MNLGGLDCYLMGYAHHIYTWLQTCKQIPIVSQKPPQYANLTKFTFFDDANAGQQHFAELKSNLFYVSQTTSWIALSSVSTQNQLGGHLHLVFSSNKDHKAVKTQTEKLCVPSQKCLCSLRVKAKFLRGTQNISERMQKHCQIISPPI